MDHSSTDESLSSGKLTLVVFLPDALESHLVGSIERWVRDRTSCVPIARQPFRFDAEALDRFYSGLAARIPEHWGLICSVFSAGPSLATLWLGDDAAARIAAVKGETHPARCPESTIRGRFWCDNPVANLVHASDDRADAARELDVLRTLVPDLFRGDLFRGNLTTGEVAPYADAGPPTPRHSGILTLCSLVARLLSHRGVAFQQLELLDGDARQTMRAAEAWLQQAPTGGSTAITRALESFVSGTAEPSELLAALQSAVRVEPWEELMLRCGILSRPAWLETR